MIPVWLKIAWAAFLVVLVPVYAVEHGLVNFLWLSDIALLIGFVAAWRESARLASMMLMSTFLFEVGWLLDYIVGLLRGGETLFGLVDYMFDADESLFVRNLSLFHVPLPWLLLWMVWRLGYDPRAFRHWLPLGWLVLIVTFFLTDAEQNVNWVYGPAGTPQTWLPAAGWLATAMVVMTAAWWLAHRGLLALAARFDRLHQPTERTAG